MNLDNSTDIIVELQQNLADLEIKIIESKRLLYSYNASKSLKPLHKITSTLDTSSAKSAIEKMEDRLRKESAAASELESMGIEKQFAALEAESGVDAELEELKKQLDT